jgi:hypothetical protein
MDFNVYRELAAAGLSPPEAARAMEAASFASDWLAENQASYSPAVRQMLSEFLFRHILRLAGGDVELKEVLDLSNRLLEAGMDSERLRKVSVLLRDLLAGDHKPEGMPARSTKGRNRVWR